MLEFILFVLGGNNISGLYGDWGYHEEAHSWGGFSYAPMMGVRAPTGVKKYVSWWRLRTAAVVWEWLLEAGGSNSVSLLVRWAAIEALNTGSLQRARCPVQLYGSGRWEASDCGGHYSQFREALLQWAEMPKERKREIARVVAVAGLPSWARSPEALSQCAAEIAALHLEDAIAGVEDGEPIRHDRRVKRLAEEARVDVRAF